jgi:hypothetical protein
MVAVRPRREEYKRLLILGLCDFGIYRSQNQKIAKSAIVFNKQGAQFILDF